MTRRLALTLCLLAAPTLAQKPAFDLPATLAQYDVVWSTPGSGPYDSMPLGNGDIGLNVWTEPTGDILFTIGKSDSWSETPSRQLGLLKVGQVRLTLSPAPTLTPGFQQALRLHDSSIEITEGTTKIHLWVDANHPAIHVDTTATQPTTVKATLEDWRTQPNGNITADTILPDQKNAVLWYHRNGPKSDPHTANHTWGALMRGPSFTGSATTLTSTAATSQQLTITPLTRIDPSVPNFLSALHQLAAQVDTIPHAAAWRAHLAWWNDFWLRSWIVLDGDATATPTTQGYLLQRYITAAEGRGAHAIKYNGGLFVMANPSVETGRDAANKPVIGPVTADFRSWGGQYWFQNTRPIYWPLLAQGDFDLMQPLFRQYFNEIAFNAPLVQQYYHHQGSYFAETAPFWGNIANLPPDHKGAYTDFYFTPVLELSMMMLDYFDYTADPTFVRQTLLPIATQGITFFDQHWQRDANGKLLLDPDNSIEMYWKVHDPTPDIAGLRAVLPRLLALPQTLTTPALRTQWQRLLTELPPLPTGTKNGQTVILPYTGDQTQPSHNTENPELYTIYPFRLYGLGKPDLTLAKATFDARLIKRTGCWDQDPVQSAFLGLAALAKTDVTYNLTRKDKRTRFPAFWDQAHDYLPDEDNGGNGQLGLETMLLQTDGSKILLLPAWPTAWNADFKLHAPLQTTLEGRVENGKITHLTVTPESRRKDIQILPTQP